MSASAKATGRRPVSRGRQSTVAGGGGSLSLASTTRVHLTFVHARLIRREISNLSVPSGIISATATTAFNGYRSAPSDVARLGPVRAHHFYEQLLTQDTSKWGGHRARPTYVTLLIYCANYS